MAGSGFLKYLANRGLHWLGTVQAALGAGEWADKERVRSRMGALAASGFIQFMPWVDPYTQENEFMRRAYRRMLADSYIKAAMFDKVLAISALDVAVSPGGMDEADERSAAFHGWMVDELDGGWPHCVENVVLPALIDGTSISEKLFGVVTEGEWAFKIRLKQVKSKDLEFLRIRVDEFNNITGIESMLNPGVVFDPAEFVIFKHITLFDVAMSDLRAAYRPWWMLDTVWKLRGIFLEKFGSGAIVGTFKKEGQQKTQLENAMDRMRSMSWTSVPEGTKIEAIDIATRGTTDYETAIRDLREEVLVGISGATLQALEGATANARGSSAIHRKVSDVRKWHLKARVEQTFKEQIFVDTNQMNFMTAKCPKLVLGGVDDTELIQSLDVDMKLLEIPDFELSRTDLYKRYGRPKPKDDNDVVKKAAVPAAGVQFAERFSEGTQSIIQRIVAFKRQPSTQELKSILAAMEGLTDDEANKVVRSVYPSWHLDESKEDAIIEMNGFLLQLAKNTRIAGPGSPYQPRYAESITAALSYAERFDETAVSSKVAAYLGRKFDAIEKRYGRAGAIAMAGAFLLTFPIPFNSALIVGAAEALRYVKQRYSMAGIERYGRMPWGDLVEEFKLTLPGLSKIIGENLPRITGPQIDAALHRAAPARLVGN